MRIDGVPQHQALLYVADLAVYLQLEPLPITALALAIYQSEAGEHVGHFAGAVAYLSYDWALTKTFIHIPLMGANPIGFK